MPTRSNPDITGRRLFAIAGVFTAFMVLGSWTTSADRSEFQIRSETAITAQDPLMAQRTKGDPGAPITIFEVTDFGCSWCREFFRLTLPDLEREYIDTGKAKLVFVNLPLPQLHPNSPAAHEFAMCAAQQDKFWPIHDLLYQNQTAWATLDEPRHYFTGLAASAGLNQDSLNTCFDTGAARWLVEQEVQSVSRQANITSTPSFIMETVLLAGYRPIEGWRPILDSLFVAKTGGRMR